MILSDLPPVGSRVSWGKTGSPLWFAGFEALFLDSGTSALALALALAKHRAGVSKPEVILPTYGCPDLVVATIHAGCTPVLVDIASADDPAYDLDLLENTCNSNTVAVVAVNFLGVRERLHAIRAVLPSHTSLVEDNAQWYPELGRRTILVGDFSVSSFGRGKPASVLGGGILLVRSKLFDEHRHFLEQQIAPSGEISAPKKRVIAGLYNILLNPFFYFWLNRNPFLSLGETHYHPLAEIQSLHPLIRQQIPANVTRYTALPRDAEKALDRSVMQTAGLSSPALTSAASPDDEVKRRGRLLRYPLVFATAEAADRAFHALDKRGLGASRMYQVPLINIPGVNEDAVLADSDQHAQLFAKRFITLPVHEGVKEKHLAEMVEAIQKHDNG